MQQKTPMKIKETIGRILLVPESAEEQAVLHSIRQAHENLIFQLQREEEGISLINLGPKEVACNVAINILYGSESESISLISNLGHTPFVMDGVQYASVEAFWQSLKFGEVERKEIAQLFGKQAKKIGKKETYKKHITYQGEKVRVGSPAHWELMKKACLHKFTQHHAAQKALLETGIRPLYHKPRKDSLAIPGPIMAGIWMDIRSKLRKEKNISSRHLDLLR
ncbi:MAG: DUF1768 domain-containing protein [Bacteroidetes bacterium]|nr:MAG: DUF1768 domain-containing protein [Bacteroidota bacterium]